METRARRRVALPEGEKIPASDQHRRGRVATWAVTVPYCERVQNSGLRAGAEEAGLKLETAMKGCTQDGAFRAEQERGPVRWRS